MSAKLLLHIYNPSFLDLKEILNKDVEKSNIVEIAKRVGDAYGSYFGFFELSIDSSAKTADIKKIRSESPIINNYFFPSLTGKVVLNLESLNLDANSTRSQRQVTIKAGPHLDDLPYRFQIGKKGLFLPSYYTRGCFVNLDSQVSFK